ncbi:IS66 family insertion sequence element accessory protein TnpA [Ruminococcus bovis]|uniref:Transposase n=1 Tax=Ruminococcus bovis TaxID=2564099 RepID=A0A4P8XUS2_9FIRM|nr:hypothetical protein [Ruminococcus bovis]QCT06801.1 hypothetical protein E5Z56_05230 [Ruminococcus bovis]QCT07256.1 hypothetical protein E5Z56_07735 [Ruminococcus bovis]
MNKGIRTLRKEQNLALWANQVEKCNNSGLSVAQWCRNNNIPVSTFWSRQKKVYEAYTQKNRPQFIEVSVEPEVNANSPMISIKRNDFTVEINNGADEATITAVLRAMKNA